MLHSFITIFFSTKPFEHALIEALKIQRKKVTNLRYFFKVQLNIFCLIRSMLVMDNPLAAGNSTKRQSEGKEAHEAGYYRASLRRPLSVSTGTSHRGRGLSVPWPQCDVNYFQLRVPNLL